MKINEYSFYIACLSGAPDRMLQFRLCVCRNEDPTVFFFPVTINVANIKTSLYFHKCKYLKSRNSSRHPANYRARTCCFENIQCGVTSYQHKLVADWRGSRGVPAILRPWRGGGEVLRRFVPQRNLHGLCCDDVGLNNALICARECGKLLFFLCE